jgi:hypothetical protein
VRKRRKTTRAAKTPAVSQDIDLGALLIVGIVVKEPLDSHLSASGVLPLAPAAGAFPAN